MSTKTGSGWSTTLAWVWTLAGAPALFALIMDFAYRVARAYGRDGFLSPYEERTWILVMGVCIASGVASLFVALSRFPIDRLWLRVVICVAYAVVLFLVMQGIGFKLACGHGDCF